MIRTLLKISPILLFLIYAAYYYFSNQSTVPMTGRTQLVDLTYEEELRLGLQSYEKILEKYKVVEEGELVEQIRFIGGKLAKVADLPQAKWEFNLLDVSQQANAFALPGGKVAVYTGLVPIAKNINGMATVLSHEIAHVVARHGAERLAYQKLKHLGLLAIGLSISDMDLETQAIVMGALGVGSHFGITLPFSRLHESEADYMGLIYMAKACFNPQEAPKLWERMQQAAAKRENFEFLSTHPSHETRIQQLKQWLPEASRVYQNHCETAQPAN